MSDDRGKGFQTPAVENPPHEQQENFTVPDYIKDAIKWVVKGE